MSNQFHDIALHPVKSDSNFNARISSTKSLRGLSRPAPMPVRDGADQMRVLSGGHAPEARSERALAAQALFAMNVGVHDELQYEPSHLLDNVRAHLGLATDAALASKLGVQPSVLSKLRHWRAPVSAALLISMQEESGLTIRDLRALMGDRRAHFSPLILPQPVTIEE